MLALQGANAAETAPAVLTARISDYTGKLPADALSYLSSSIEDGEKGGGPRIRVLVIDVTAGQTFDDYAQVLLAAQPIESKVDALLVLQPAARTARIAVSEAARPRLSSVAARVILRESVSSNLREDNLFAAIEQGTKKIEASLRAVPGDAASVSARQDKTGAAAAADIPPYAPVTDLSGALAAQDIEGLVSDIAAPAGAHRRTGGGADARERQARHAQGPGAACLRRLEAGPQGVDDGVLIVVARDDRRMRIEVGYGLDGVLTDIASGRSINEHVRPLFKRGDFGGGLSAALEQVGRVIEVRRLQRPRRSATTTPACQARGR